MVVMAGPFFLINDRKLKTHLKIMDRNDFTSDAGYFFTKYLTDNDISVPGPSKIIEIMTAFSEQQNTALQQHLQAVESRAVVLEARTSRHELINAQMKAVLRKLIESFPEFETDEPIAGSDAVATLCGMWQEIKEAAK